MNSCKMCPLKQLLAPTMIAVIIRLWNLWPPFALGPGCYGRSSLLWFWLCADCMYDGVKTWRSNQPTNKQRDSGTYNLEVGLEVKIQFIPDDDNISDNQKPQTTTIIVTWIVVDSYRIVAMNRSWCWKNCVLKVTLYYISLNNVFNSYVCYGMVLHCIILYSVEQ